MSFLYADNIRDTSGNITIPSYGSVINTSTMRYDGRPGYYARGWVAGDNASTLFALRLTANNVQHPNNILVASWQLSIETDNNTTFKVLKNGSWQDNRLGTSNSAAPSDEWYWKGLVCAYHDGDNSTTPSNYQLLYICRAGSVGSVNLDIVAQAADDGGRTVWINRTYASAGGDNNEICVCTGVVFEIAHESGVGLTD